MKNGSVILSEITGGDIKNIKPETIKMAALKGDKLSKGIWNETGEYLGIVLASLINLLNIEAIVVCGGISKNWDVLKGPVQRTIAKRAFDTPRKAVKIYPAKSADETGVVGAALLFEQEK